ncbi:MAG TPA: hypothetical protein VFZ59_26760 [Verrucomicrobiae bacterium]|nr:hypothetical protein [Verrucomicrobiae bacterium]
MRNIQKRFYLPLRVCGWFLSIFIALIAARVQAADILLPTLRIGTDVFTNVTVYQMTATDIFVRHSKGFGNAKVNSLDDDTLVLLGLKERKPERAPVENPLSTALSPAQTEAAAEQVKTALARVNLQVSPEQIEMVKGQIARVTGDPRLAYGILGGLALLYFLYCLCLRNICVNAGSKPGLLIWLPGLQMFPLLRAAKMPIWWFLVFCLPVLNILAHLLWCARIAAACGKGFFTGLMLFLPVTNVLALLYLAFSGGGGDARPMGKPFRNEGLPGLAGA